MTDKELIDSAIRNDVGCWFESDNAKIVDKAHNTVTPRQNYLQKKVQDTVFRFEQLGLPIRIIGLKPRQKGSTTYFGALDYHTMRRRPTSYCVIGGQLSQTDSLWAMLTCYNSHDRFAWGNTGDVTATAGSWSNGSLLTAETANDKLAGISNTYQGLHCTEVARWQRYGVANAAGVLSNILKCVPLLPNTIVILESTAEGANGSYYERFVSSVDCEDFISGKVTIQEGDYVRIFAPWFEFEDSVKPKHLTDAEKKHIEATLDADPSYDGEKDLIASYAVTDGNGVRHLGGSVKSHDIWEQLAWRRYAIEKECEGDKNIFDRDFPHSWQTAFQKSGQQRFNAGGLAMLRKRISQRAALYGILEEAQGRMAFRPTDKNEARVIVYERPTPGRRYILSVDPMTGAMQATGEDPDYHGVFVLREGYWDSAGNWNRTAAVARIIPCRWDIDVLELDVWRLARFYGDSSGCKIVIEMNMDRGLTELLKQRGADLYMREVFNQTEYKTTKAYGYLTMEKTRERVVESLAAAIREHSTPGEGIDIWDDHAITQCENFIRKGNGRSEAAEGHHDDDIFGIGIGHLLITHATTYLPNRGGQGLPPDLAGLVNAPGPQVSAFS
jgi:hypothetical protein